MKLFYKPGACSLATHIALREIGVSFEIEEVNTDTGITTSGLDYKLINPKGYVPALAVASGDIFTEGPSILQYIADQNPDKKLAPLVNTIARVKFQEYLSYINSELHKAFSPLFSSSTNDDDKAAARINVAGKLDYLNKLLGDGRVYLLGDNFTVADAYLFVVSNWANFVGIDLDKWPNVEAFVTRVSSRPTVQSAMKAEGLL